MKTLVTNSFNVGGYAFTLTTAIYARKRYGLWEVSVNYHKLRIAIEEPDEDSVYPRTVELETTANGGIIDLFASIVQLYGLVEDVVAVIISVFEALTDIGSLINNVIKWAQDALARLLAGQEPFDRKPYDDAVFILNLMKDGTTRRRKRPRGRRKFASYLT